jgi:hypothetical protein
MHDPYRAIDVSRGLFPLSVPAGKRHNLAGAGFLSTSMIGGGPALTAPE